MKPLDRLEKTGTGFLKKILQVLPSARFQSPASKKIRINSKTDLCVSLSFVSAPEMSLLNQKFRKKKKVTDILSFSAPLLFQKRGLLGELVVCTPVLRKQAKENGHSVENELLILLVHGCLHLLEWDHERSRAEALKMSRLEKLLLQSVVKKRALVNLLAR